MDAFVACFGNGRSWRNRPLHRKTAFLRFPPVHRADLEGRLPWPDPRVGTIKAGKAHGSAGNGQTPLRPCAGRGERLVSEKPPSSHTRPASPPVVNDAGPLRLLRRRRQHATIAVVRPPSCADLAEVAVSARSAKRGQMDPPQRDPATTPPATRPDRSSIRHRELTSTVKNRMREIRTSGSVRSGGGNVPTYSATRPGAGAHGERARGPRKKDSRFVLAIFRNLWYSSVVDKPLGGKARLSWMGWRHGSAHAAARPPMA